MFLGRLLAIVHCRFVPWGVWQVFPKWPLTSHCKIDVIWLQFLLVTIYSTQGGYRSTYVAWFHWEREPPCCLCWVPDGEICVKKFKCASSAIAIDLAHEQTSLPTLAMSSAALLATATYSSLQACVASHRVVQQIAKSPSAFFFQPCSLRLTQKWKLWNWTCHLGPAVTSLVGIPVDVLECFAGFLFDWRLAE